MRGHLKLKSCQRQRSKSHSRPWEELDEEIQSLIPAKMKGEIRGEGVNLIPGRGGFRHGVFSSLIRCMEATPFQVGGTLCNAEKEHATKPKRGGTVGNKRGDGKRDSGGTNDDWAAATN